MNKKPLIIYYSYEGNTRFIAESIKKSINADIVELRPKKEMSTKGFMKYVWGGKNVMLKQKPALHPFEKNLDDYDLIFIGTPVWAFTYAPPLRTLFSTWNPTKKYIAVFCCHEGGMKNTLEKMKQELKDNTIIGENDFNHPLVNNPEKQKQKAISWAKTIIDEGK